MRCPHCGSGAGRLSSTEKTIGSVNVIVIYCSACLKIVGVVND